MMTQMHKATTDIKPFASWQFCSFVFLSLSLCVLGIPSYTNSNGSVEPKKARLLESITQRQMIPQRPTLFSEKLVDSNMSTFPHYITNQGSRKQRLLSIFSIVSFANVACRATPSTTALATPSTVTVATTAPTTSDGTCSSNRECRRYGGISSGTCASGYGTCCLYELTCDATARANISYFINPEYPGVSTTARSCVLLITKSSPNVVQLRLDFENFRLNGVTGGLCSSDALSITGQNSDNRIPLICGLNDGQHAYVNVGNSPGPYMLAVTTSGVGNRQWRIKTTQLERGNPLLAPVDCLQYFAGVSGLLKSFNFDSPPPVNGQSNYINDLNYALCVRREAGSCMVRYTATTDPNSFDLDQPDVMSGLDGTCIGDFLFIPGSGNAPPAMAGPIGSRFCGAALSATAGSATSNPIINSLSGPIQLTFVTNGNAPTGIANRGFSIRYQQIPCSVAG